MREDFICFLCIKLRTTLLLMGTKAKRIVTKKFPDKWQYKLHCTVQLFLLGHTSSSFFTPNLCVLIINTNKLPKKPEQQLIWTALVQKNHLGPETHIVVSSSVCQPQSDKKPQTTWILVEQRKNSSLGRVSGIALFTTTTKIRPGAKLPITLTQSSKQKFHLGHPSKFCYCDHLWLKPKIKKKIKSKANLEQTHQKNKGENNPSLQQC